MSTNERVYKIVKIRILKEYSNYILAERVDEKGNGMYKVCFGNVDLVKMNVDKNNKGIQEVRTSVNNLW